MDRFRRLVAAQGGDLSKPLPIGSHSETVTAGASGTMGDIDYPGPILEGPVLDDPGAAPPPPAAGGGA